MTKLSVFIFDLFVLSVFGSVTFGDKFVPRTGRRGFAPRGGRTAEEPAGSSYLPPTAAAPEAYGAPDYYDDYEEEPQASYSEPQVKFYLITIKFIYSEKATKYMNFTRKNVCKKVTWAFLLLIMTCCFADTFL